MSPSRGISHSANWLTINELRVVLALERIIARIEADKELPI